jgi:photosystem I subunit 8
MGGNRWPTAETVSARAELLCRAIQRCRVEQKASLQYRRLLLALAMTGEFAAAWMPAVFVPLVGILGPAVAMALLFNVIEARD